MTFPSAQAPGGIGARVQLDTDRNGGVIAERHVPRICSNRGEKFAAANRRIDSNWL